MTYQVIWRMTPGGEDKKTKPYDTMEEAQRMMNHLIADGMLIVTVKQIEEGKQPWNVI